MELYPDRLEVSNPGSLPYGFTIDQLTQLHNSQPSNPILAHPVYLAGYIERIGTGTTDIVEKCVEAGLPTPEYKQDGTGFKVVIWRKHKNEDDPQTKLTGQGISMGDVQNDAQNDAQKLIATRARKILEKMISNPHISKDTIASELGISEPTVRRTIKSLRASYHIEWIGLSKSGRWKIYELK